MRMSDKNDLYTAVKSGTPMGFKDYNSEEAAGIFKTLNVKEAAYARAAYATTQYGKYTLATTVLAASSLYLGALFLAPALIPFGLAAIATTWIKYTVAAAMLAAVLYSGAIFLKSTYSEFKKLVDRFKDKKLSNHDIALLGTAGVAGFSVVGMMYAFPTMLPLLGTLGTYTKAATATVIGTASTVAVAAAFFGRPATVTPPTLGRGQRSGLESELNGEEIELSLQHR